MVFYKNNSVSLDYQKPYLILKVMKYSLNEIEVKQMGIVLKKFYKTLDKGKPIKFGMIIHFEKIGVFNMTVMKKIGKIFENLKESSQKQLYGSAIILNQELHYFFNQMLKLFKNDRPISFVKDMDEANLTIKRYITENTFVTNI